jgi:hypothetical protein
LSHSPGKLHVSFDDPNLVSYAGLVPVMALAQRGVRGQRGCEDRVPGRGHGRGRGFDR